MANRLITVARADYMHRAYFYKNWLDSAGIESIIFNQGIDGAAAGNEIELQVDENDVSRALEVVEMASLNYESLPKETGKRASSIKNILVPIDFTRHSLNSAKYALHVAKQKNASVTIIHVYYDGVSNPVTFESFYSYPSDLTDTQREIEQNANEKMDEFMASIEQYRDIEGISDVKPKRKIMAGTADDVILALAESGQFDLLIVGAHELISSDSWFGNFTTRIIENSTIPVLAVPEDAVYKKSNFKRLMYATNFDKSDGIAIRKLINIAAPLDTQIHVVHIDVTDSDPFINFDLSHFREKYIGDIGDINMVYDLIINENIVKGIEDYIKEKKIDILAVTTHKRNLITSFLRPSITRELLFEVHIPLLIFHSNP